MLRCLGVPKREPLGPMIGQGPGGPKKAFKGLLRPIREALRRRIKPLEGPDKDLRGLIRSLKGLLERSILICGRCSIKRQGGLK